MTAGAVAAAAAQARSRRRVIDSFREQSATSPRTAISFHPLRRIDNRTFERLLKKNVLLPADNRRFYLDLEALAADDRARTRFRTVALTTAGAAALATLAAVLLG